MSKGSRQRPTDPVKYREGWERIFGKKTEEKKPKPKIRASLVHR